MKSFDQIRQNLFWLYRHTFIKRFFTHIAIHHPLLLESTEISITFIIFLQYIVGESPRITIDNAPILCLRCLLVYGFEIEGYTTRLLVVLQKIIGAGILEQLGQEALSTYCIPVASPKLTTEYYRTFLDSRSQGLQFIVLLLYFSKRWFAFSSVPVSKPINFIHSACPKGVISL